MISTNIDLLKELELFKNFNSSEIDGLATILVEQTYRPGEVIFHEGEKGPELYIIKSGEIEIVKEGGAGQRQLLVVLEEGSVFGEMAILDGNPRSASAIASGEENTELLILKKDYLEALSHRDLQLVAKVLMAIISYVSERLRATTERSLFSQRILSFD